MDVWIKSAINESAYRKAYDSCLVIMANDSITINDFVLLDAKAIEYEKILTKTIKKKTRLVYLWETITGIITCAWFIREIKN